MNIDFDLVRSRIADQFAAPHWIPDSGMDMQELEQAMLALEKCGYSRAMTKTGALI